MAERFTKGEMHGCIVCGKLYQLYVVTDENGGFVDARVMGAGGKLVQYESRPLAACERHTTAEIERAIARVYARPKDEDDD
jgi:hypothetical protein